VERLTSTEGVSQVFSRPVFHETVLRLDRPAAPVLEALAAERIVGGFSLKEDYPELGEALLVCATETKTADDIDAYAQALSKIMNKA
jgi:glycine dehydrogenase subunit 1